MALSTSNISTCLTFNFLKLNNVLYQLLLRKNCSKLKKYRFPLKLIHVYLQCLTIFLHNQKNKIILWIGAQQFKFGHLNSWIYF